MSGNAENVQIVSSKLVFLQNKKLKELILSNLKQKLSKRAFSVITLRWSRLQLSLDVDSLRRLSLSKALSELPNLPIIKYQLQIPSYQNYQCYCCRLEWCARLKS